MSSFLPKLKLSVNDSKLSLDFFFYVITIEVPLKLLPLKITEKNR